MKTTYLCLAGIAMMAGTLLTANATTIDFRSGGTNAGSYYGNERTFTADGVTVTVSAVSWTGSSWRNGHLGRSSTHGLYNRNSRNDNSHTVDNQGWTDYILFSFSEAVNLLNVDTWVQSGYDGDFEYWISPGSGAPTTGGSQVVNPHPGGLSTISGTTDYLLLGAVYAESDDRFKIRSLSFEQASSSTVPDGGGSLLLLGISILGVFGFVQKKKNTRGES